MPGISRCRRPPGTSGTTLPTSGSRPGYRGHAHTLARGVQRTPVLAELFGRGNGLMGGKGGSMHLTSVEHGMMGSHAIIGAFHEALNFAAVYRLPVVFVCENNRYLEYTSIADVTAVPHPAADRAGSYGLKGQLIDGNDADDCYLAAVAALDRARRGEGPSLIEASTYRYAGHGRDDVGRYRPQAEVDAAWRN